VDNRPGSQWISPFVYESKMLPIRPRSSASIAQLLSSASQSSVEGGVGGGGEKTGVAKGLCCAGGTTAPNGSAEAKPGGGPAVGAAKPGRTEPNGDGDNPGGACHPGGGRIGATEQVDGANGAGEAPHAGSPKVQEYRSDDGPSHGDLDVDGTGRVPHVTELKKLACGGSGATCRGVP